MTGLGLCDPSMIITSIFLYLKMAGIERLLVVGTFNIFIVGGFKNEK